MTKTNFNVNNPIDSDLQRHVPKSLQIMMEIEDRAQAAVRDILADITAGKTTLEAAKRKYKLV